MADALANVWAKSSIAEGAEGETLSAHSGEVLARLASWRERTPLLSDLCGRADLWDLTAWACVLHDVGKIARGFQSMLRGGGRFIDRHEVLSLVAVGWLEVPNDICALVAAGVATHHKDVSEILDERYPLDAPKETERLLAELDDGDERRLRRWLAGDGIPNLLRLGFAALPSTGAASKAEAFARAVRRLAILREDLNQHDATEPEALTARFVRGLVMLADHCGSAHARHGYAPTLDDPVTLERLFLKNGPAAELWPHQRAAAAAVGHVVLRAPTGSGKTEAALLWAARQRHRDIGSPPIFYVLPYRASLNAMRRRIPERYGVPEGSVVLQHSSATAALYGYLLAEKGYTREAATRAALAERNAGTLMTASVRILTPYQLLRALFGVPGHETILTDAAGGLFVLDELHAYDVVRLALILCLVRHLARDLGARFLAMSATLPSVLKKTWEGILGLPPTDVVATAETQSRFRRHRLRLRDRGLTEPDTLQEIIDRASRGQAVLVVATTVNRAQRIYDALLPRIGGAVWLLHSRFTGEDRGRKELALTNRVGTGKRRGGNGSVLVATQVVEVSLDIDFDALFSDPAPIEALLQRFGRVNRSCRGTLQDVVVHETIPNDSRYVYDDLHLKRALDILRQHGEQAIEESALQQWVDAVYEPVADAWQRCLLRQIEEHEEALLRVNRPLDSHPELAERFDELFDGAEVVPACLEERYRRLLDEAPLESAGLRVPVSFGQRQRLLRKGWLRRQRIGRLPFEVADLSYDVERGLDLKGPDHQP